jgi:hypothetical protein
MPSDAEQQALDLALRTLAAHRTGAISFGEHVRPIKFVLDNEDGRLVCPVMVAVLEEPEIVMFIPEESDEALQLLLDVEEVDEKDHSRAIDKWIAHHGDPEDIHWVACWIDAARMGPVVIDGDALMNSNPLAGAEARTCRRINEDKDALRALCARYAKMDVEDPLCVAVAPLGLSVKSRFDILFVPFGADIETESALDAEIDRLLAEARA